MTQCELRFRQVSVWRDATRLLVEAEQAVRAFPLPPSSIDIPAECFAEIASGVSP